MSAPRADTAPVLPPIRFFSDHREAGTPAPTDD